MELLVECLLNELLMDLLLGRLLMDLLLGEVFIDLAVGEVLPDLLCFYMRGRHKSMLITDGLGMASNTFLIDGLLENLLRPTRLA